MTTMTENGGSGAKALKSMHQVRITPKGRPSFTYTVRSKSAELAVKYAKTFYCDIRDKTVEYIGVVG